LAGVLGLLGVRVRRVEREPRELFLVDLRGHLTALDAADDLARLVEAIRGSDDPHGRLRPEAGRRGFGVPHLGVDALESQGVGDPLRLDRGRIGGDGPDLARTVARGRHRFEGGFASPPSFSLPSWPSAAGLPSGSATSLPKYSGIWTPPTSFIIWSMGGSVR